VCRSSPRFAATLLGTVTENMAAFGFIPSFRSDYTIKDENPPSSQQGVQSMRLITRYKIPCPEGKLKRDLILCVSHRGFFRAPVKSHFSVNSPVGG
jgi:hypothetical protein